MDIQAAVLPAKLINTSWYLFRLAPLFGFRRDQGSFARYRQGLGALLQARGQSGASTAGGGSARLPPSEQRDLTRVGQITMTTLTGLQVAEEDVQPVHIVLHSKQVLASGAEAAALGQVILCGCGTPQHGEFTHFPLLLAKGLKSFIQAILAWLEVSFLSRSIRVQKLSLPRREDHER